MTFSVFGQISQRFLFFILACILPFAANSVAEEVIAEKRNVVAMRMIGHEVLICLGDSESRVMPIEKIDELYKISFEFKFGFDPGDLISIIDRVMSETNVATNYLVEVEQCKTKKVVYSYEIIHDANPDLVACSGRTLPEDCYNLLITILDGASPYLADEQVNLNFMAEALDNPPIIEAEHSEQISSDGLSLTSSGTKESNLFQSAFLLIPLLFLIGLIVYYVKNRIPYLKGRQPDATDPNLILIGASQFDKRNMALSIENKKVELSNKEAELLSVLHTSANSPIEREVILQRVWGDEGDYVGRTLDVFISKLRKKLEGDASVKIVNIRGVGYKLVTDLPK